MVSLTAYQKQKIEQEPIIVALGWIGFVAQWQVSFNSVNGRYVVCTNEWTY